MLGYETHELLQLSPFKIAVPGDAHLLEESYTAKQDRETTTYEVRLQHRNGRFIHAFVTSVPRIQNNQVIGSISVITDLTERNKAEQKLLHSEQKHKQLFVSAQRQTQELALLARLNASLARELDLSIIYVTVVDALADTFGYDLVSLYTRQGDKLILQHQRGFTNVHPSLSINFGVIGRVIRTGESAFVTDTQLDNDYISLLQDDVNHSELCVPLFYESNIVGAINIESAHVNAFSEEDLHLLTMLSEHVSIAIERAYLHNKVIYNEKRFRALVEHNPATITLVDKLGNFQPINTITPSFHNQNQKNLFDPDSIHPNDIEKVKTTFQSLLKSPGSSQNIIYRILTENGGIQWVEKTFTNLLNEPAVQAVVINSRDITERKQAEEALQQAQKLESLGILAGGIAHDFNNLLVAMMGQISLAQLKGKKDSMAQPHLQKAYTATERASALTRQLLAYSGKGQFQIESIDLNQLITDNLHLFSVGLPKTIQLSSDLHEPLPPVRVDIGQMQQVIMNLIINGKEAIGNESGIVNITTGVSHITPSISQSWPAFGIAPPAGDYVMLTVTDNGTGMDEETLSKIGDPFFTTKFTGRGLGLAAVQGIVRGHNGGLTVHSTPNHGSRFDLLFPIDTASMMPTNEKIIKEKSAAYMAEPIPIRQSNDDKMALVKGMILVVDDEAPVRDTLNDILSSESLEVLTAVNSQDGIQQLQQQQNRIKLIILDLSMPGLSIKEAITQFRQITPNIPLMISSGYSESEANQQLGDLDVAGFLQKPYNVKKLITIVNKQLAENREKTDENTFIYKQEIS
ncbi:MAG: PAS domain S-box protein [Chloroflexi bacterium]|nr:MAG: PAS domain S-box protein [Chloroflexota bacterium]